MNQAPRPAFFVRLACLCANRFGLRLRALVENFVQLVGKMPSPVRSGELEAYAALRALRDKRAVPTSPQAAGAVRWMAGAVQRVDDPHVQPRVTL